MTDVSVNPPTTVAAENVVEIIDAMFDDDVAELDVHDGGHGLFLATQEGGAETDAQVGLVHEIGLAGSGHFDQMLRQSGKHLAIDGRQAVLHQIRQGLHLHESMNE